MPRRRRNDTYKRELEDPVVAGEAYRCRPSRFTKTLDVVSALRDEWQGERASGCQERLQVSAYHVRNLTQNVPHIAVDFGRLLAKHRGSEMNGLVDGAMQGSQALLFPHKLHARRKALAFQRRVNVDDWVDFEAEHRLKDAGNDLRYLSLPLLYVNRNRHDLPRLELLNLPRASFCDGASLRWMRAAADVNRQHLEFDLLRIGARRYRVNKCQGQFSKFGLSAAEPPSFR